MTINLRQAERIQTFLRGKIVVGRGLPKIDCVIRDLSDSGAKIELAASDDLPDSFELEIPKKGSTYTVELRWRYENRAGLRFTGRVGDVQFNTISTRAELIEENARLRAAVRVLGDRLRQLGVPVDSSLFGADNALDATSGSSLAD